MNKRYNTLGYMIMEILRQDSSCGFPMSYGVLTNKLNELYSMFPAANTLACTLKALNEQAFANIQGVGGKRGLWLTEDASEMLVEALFAPVVTADYLSENCIEQFQKLLTRLHKKGPFGGLEKPEPRSQRQRLTAFLNNMETINEARLNHFQLGFTYNDLNIEGKYVPRCKPSHPDGIIVLSVYKIFCRNTFYYMVGKRENENFLRNYRIDKMTKLFNTNRKAEPISNIPGYENKETLPLSKYLKGNYKMFNTNPVFCTFKLKNYDKNNLNYYVSTIWDEIGNNYLKWINEKNEIRFTARLPAKGAVLFAKQFGDFVELLSPENLRQELKCYYKFCLKDYSKIVSEKN